MKRNLKTSLKNINQRLIKKSANGHRKSQFKLYDLYHEAIYITIYRICGDRTLAEDIMQEAFLTAFQKLKQWNQDAEFGAWLKKIAVNKTIDELKKNKLFTTEIKEIHDKEEEIENIKLPQVSQEDIKELLLKLPDKYRAIISLFLFEGYDHNEISQILKISSGNSRSLYSRAKKKMIEQIKLLS